MKEFLKLIEYYPPFQEFYEYIKETEECGDSVIEGLLAMFKRNGVLNFQKVEEDGIIKVKRNEDGALDEKFKLC